MIYQQTNMGIKLVDIQVFINQAYISVRILNLRFN